MAGDASSVDTMVSAGKGRSALGRTCMSHCQGDLAGDVGGLEDHQDYAAWLQLWSKERIADEDQVSSGSVVVKLSG